jgi:phosphoribosyl-ATP pyrophosphohydrolase
LANDAESIWRRLEEVIRRRKSASPESSYTARLLAGGTEAIGAKVTEEAAETVEAAAEPGQAGTEHLVREAADLVFHLLVLLGHKDVSISLVETELARRFGVSGLQEKAARGETVDPPSPPSPPNP